MPPTSLGNSREHIVRFVATGDLLLGRGIRKIMGQKGYDYPLNKVAPILKKGDLVLVNLESPVTRRGRPVRKKFTFRGDPDVLPALRKAGINVVNLANNHTLDYGRIGLSDTLKHVKKANLLFVGAGRNEQEAHKPLTVTKNGIRIAFLAYTAFPTYGVIPNSKSLSVASCRKISVLKRDISLARKRADVVIASFHWGKEFETKPTKLQRFFAHTAVDAGADLVIGHHPHVLQPVEHYHGKLILYSLGNFVFDHTDLKTRQSAIFKCHLTPQGTKGAKYIPVRIERLQPLVKKF